MSSKLEEPQRRLLLGKHLRYTNQGGDGGGQWADEKADLLLIEGINLLTWCENGFILSPTQGREHRQMKRTTDARHRLPGRMRCSQTNSRQTD